MHLLVSYYVQSTALDIVGAPKMNETSSLLKGSYIQGARLRLNKERLVDIGGGRGERENYSKVVQSMHYGSMRGVNSNRLDSPVREGFTALEK